MKTEWRSSLSMDFSTWGCIWGGLLLLGVLYLCYTGYKRNPRWQTAALECLRFVIVVFVLLLLAKPEWVTNYASSDRPEVAVLWDDSGSMDTQDVEQGTAGVVSRREQVKRLLDTKFWTALEDRNKVTVNAFSTPEKMADGKVSPLAGTDIEKALEETLTQSSNLRAVVLISDGDNTKGAAPVISAQKYRNRSIPVFTVPVGSEVSLPDIAIEEVRPPAYGIVEESVQIPFTIRSSLGRAVTTTVTLRAESGASVSKDVKLPAYGDYSDTILWNITKEGAENLELFVPVLPGERADNNNKTLFRINGRRESIRVLIVESEPRWEYRFIRNALYRDPGVQVNTLLFHPTIKKLGEGDGYLKGFPEKMEEISQYDVIFIGDVGVGKDGLTEKQAELIKGLVQSQASGIVFLPGYRGNQKSLEKSPLGELLPVLMEEGNAEGYSDKQASPLLLTPDGRGSLLTLLGNSEAENAEIWRYLPGFYWHAPVERAKAGSLVLATHSTKRNRYGRIPLLVTQTSGAGKVLYMGTDAAWRWRRGVEDKYHYRFWGQVARWMSYQRNMAAGDRVRVYPNQERPGIGDSVLLTATVADEHGAPLKKGRVTADITAPDGKRKSSVELSSDGTSWGVYTGYVKIDMPGEWKISVFNADEPDKAVSLSLFTAGDSVEKLGRLANPDLLKEISDITGGRQAGIDELSALTQDIIVLPAPKPHEVRYLIWCNWVTGLVLLFLLAIFWIGRKLNGTI